MSTTASAAPAPATAPNSVPGADRTEELRDELRNSRERVEQLERERFLLLKGVPEEDLAFVTEKFFRGTNAEGKQGSGLGLYLAKWFMERQQGGMECYNADGFHVELFVRKV